MRSNGPKINLVTSGRLDRQLMQNYAEVVSAVHLPINCRHVTCAKKHRALVASPASGWKWLCYRVQTDIN